MTVSKIRVNGTDHDIRAKYLVPSSDIMPTERTFTSGTSGVSQDMGEAVATVQKIKGNTYVDTANGIFVGTTATAIKSVGFNQWDEQWVVDNGKIVSVNYCPCTGGQVYYLKCGTYTSRYYLQIQWYDATKAFISSEYRAGQTATAPATACYFKIATQSSNYVYGTDYKSDICINLSDPAKNGTYEPYKQSLCPLNITTLKGKLNGAGSSVTIFPHGMGYVETLIDELTSTKAKRAGGFIDLGSLTWTAYSNFYFASLPTEAKTGPQIVCGKYTYYGKSGESAFSSNAPDKSIGTNFSRQLNIKDSSYATAAALQTSLDGVLLYYELAATQEYILDTPLNLSYASFYGGTESILPVQSPTITSAPLDALISYSAGDVQALMGSQVANISNDSLKNLLDAMVTAGVISAYTMVWNAETGKYDFTITD